MKKILAGAALAGILTLSAGTVAAQAAPEVPAAPPASVDLTGPQQPGTVTFNGSGFTPGETIDVTVTVIDPMTGDVTGTLPASTTVADANGSFSTLLILEPEVLFEQVSDTFSLLATGQMSGTTVKHLTTLASSGPVDGAGGLANTGIEASTMVWSLLGAGALGAGVGLVAVSRRRNRIEQAAWQP